MRGTALQLGKEWTGVGADLGANCRNASYCQTEYVNTILPLYTAAPSPTEGLEATSCSLY